MTDIDQTCILIISGDAVDRQAISQVLTREGYLCFETGTPTRIEKAIAENRPNAIVLDIAMSGMSGFDLLHDITLNHPNLPIIIATGDANPRIVVECMRSGARDYLTKPFDTRELIVSVNRVVEINKLEQKINSYHSQLELIIKDQKQEIRDLFLGSIEGLVHALEFKDKYTAGHARRVTDLAVAIGREMGFGQSELDDLRWGALLHDVGKVAVEASVQNKNGKLTSEEYYHVMTHPLVGAEIISRVANPRILEIVLHHHDRYDGTGLYQTLRGDDIPLGARVVAVADSFDAMTSSRTYRSAMSREHGVDEIKLCSGTQFDPQVVSAFLKLKCSWSIEMAHSTNLST